jgi:hypothetical protein
MFHNNQEFVQCYSQNISKGGIYLETAVLPDPNARVELVLDLSNAAPGLDLGQVSLYGRIVRLMSLKMDGKAIHKIAIQFVDTPPDIQAKLDALYNKLASAEFEA